MRIFVTGATGYIGQAVVAELIGGGHSVVGLARSNEGAKKLKAAGADVQRGSLEDLESLKNGVQNAEGVIHLAFIHDFSNFAHSLDTDLRAIETMGGALAGSGKAFITTAHANGDASDNAVLALTKRGVRASVASLAPSVHGDGDKGFVPRLIQIARAKGVSAYVGDGQNRWPAVHRLDAAKLFRLAVESAPAGSRLDGVGEEGIPFRDIAEVIGRKLGLSTVSVSPEEAAAHFGFLGPIAAFDMPRSSEKTRQMLGWQPQNPTLLDDLENGGYFD
jgi:nucleoside-diphosphate-sugar epimerase